MTEGWLHILAAEVQMSPGFLAALDRQLGDHASRLIGIADFATSYTLLPRDDRFTIEFRTTRDGTIGVIEGDLVDPSAFGHPVSLGWRARGVADEPVSPEQDRDDVEFFWIELPAELSAGTRIDTRAIAAEVTAPFPVEWDVHQCEGLVLCFHAHRAFSVEELDTLTASVQRAVADWNAREPATIDYLAEPERDPDRAWVSWYLDLGVAGHGAVIAVINAVGATPAASALARCSIGRRR